MLCCFELFELFFKKLRTRDYKLKTFTYICSRNQNYNPF